MHLVPFRRRARLRQNWLRVAILTSFIALYVDYLHTAAVSYPLTRVLPSTTSSKDPSGRQTDRIFIASMHWNNEHIIRSHWNAAVLDLVQHLGAKNVYISIVESGSWDDTKGALRDLDTELEKLGVERSIQMHEVTHKDEIERTPGPYGNGWIYTGRGRKELRRIPYLADIRNQVMEPLKTLAERTGGRDKRSFDKILWLNDVIFTTEDVTTLIATRGGSYEAACSLDFSKPPQYYDTFALRDISGAKPVTPRWPFFLAAASRKAMITNSPVPVKSCWNGIVVFQADSFYDDPPLHFRGLPDSLAAHHLEASECCLIHIDNRRASTHGIWLNPNVRVSYNYEASKLVNAETWLWPSRTEKLTGIWTNRWARLIGILSRHLERYRVGRRTQLWRHEAQEASPELHKDWSHCLINEMQVLRENGWAHV